MWTTRYYFRPMDDVIHDAAEAIVPLLSAGAGAAAHGIAEQAGSRLTDAAGAVIQKVRRRLPGGRPNVGQVEDVLRAALEEGELSRQDLNMVVSSLSIGRDDRSMRAGKNIYYGNTIDVENGDFNG